MTSPQQGATGTGQKQSASRNTLWIEIALLAGVFSRLSAGLVLAAFFITPALGAFGVWGAAGGSALIGLGWFWLGVQLMRRKGEPVASG